MALVLIVFICYNQGQHATISVKGLRKPRPRKDLFDIMGKTKRWTEAEDNILRELYPLAPKKEILKAIMRTWTAIICRASRLGIIRMRSENNNRERIETETIKQVLLLAKTKSVSDIAKETGLKRRYVYEVLERNNVAFIPDKRWWTDEEREFLKNNYYLPMDELEIRLGKKAKAIRKYARTEFGLSRPRKDGVAHREFSIIDDDESQRIRELIAMHSPSEVGRILERSGSTIIRHCTIHGIGMPHKRLSFNDFTDERLLEMLKEYAKELGRTPMILDIQNNKKFPSVDIYYNRFGKYSTACIKAGLLPNGGILGTSCLSKNDDWCFSISEQYITNYFIDNNIPYEKEVPYSYVIGNNRTNSLIMDWYIYGKYAVEYFGIEKQEDYDAKTKKKIRLCKNYKIPLIELYPNDLVDLDKIFNNIK